jgi:Radical SAM superfamily/B12 binding domain
MKISLVNVVEFEPIQDFLNGRSEQTGSTYPPIGLLTLAAVLEKQSYEVNVIDVANLILNRQLTLDNAVWRNAAAYICQDYPDVVGFSSRCDNYLHSLRIAAEVRRLSPGTPIIFGGPQATITDTATLNRFEFIDCVVRHEAEYSLPLLLQAFGGNYSLENIPGIVYRRDGQIVRNPDPPLITDLDQIPIPEFRHFPIQGFRIMPIEVGRGCPFGCTFCITNRYFNRKYRLKSPDRIIDEGLLLQEQYGFSKFNFIHDMLTASRPMVLELCKRIKQRNAKFQWNCSARTDCVDRQLLETMLDAGCRDIYFGIETGSQRMQKIVNKNLKLDEVFPVIDLCSDLGIAATTSFITGFPEEKQDDVEDTLQMMLRLSHRASNVQLHLYSPTPGTPLNDKFSDRLIFTGYISDFGFATKLDAQERELVINNPDIFTNYFQVQPLYLDLDSITGLDAFGYSMQYFKYLFFYLVNEPEAPSLVELWNDLKRWTKDNGLKWDIGEYLANGLSKPLEKFLRQRLAQMPRSLTLSEAFKLDLALLKLGEANQKIPGGHESTNSNCMPKEVFVHELEVNRVTLRTAIVCTEVRCNIATMIEALRIRRPLYPAVYDTPRTIGIFVAKDLSKGQKLAFIEVTEMVHAILDECRDGPGFCELVERVSRKCSASGRREDHIRQLCRHTIQRLILLQLLVAQEHPAQDYTVQPEVIEVDVDVMLAPNALLAPQDANSVLT